MLHWLAAKHCALEEDTMAVAEPTIRKPLPFDAGRLDRLLDDAGIDVLVATSKHNIQYLLGRLPLLLLRHHGCDRHQPLPAGARLPQGQAGERRLRRLRHGDLREGARPVLAARARPGAHRQRGGHAAGGGAHQEARRRCAASASSCAFLPADAEAVLRQGLSNVEIVDAVFPLERLRARKTPEEIELPARGLRARGRLHAGDLQGRARRA